MPKQAIQLEPSVQFITVSRHSFAEKGEAYYYHQILAIIRPSQAIPDSPPKKMSVQQELSKRYIDKQKLVQFLDGHAEFRDHAIKLQVRDLASNIPN